MLCVFTGYKYAGLSYSYECWCTNSGYDRYGEGTGCDDPCPGNANQICGGSLRISVYLIGMSKALCLQLIVCI